jgi:hypothetical protein
MKTTHHLLPILLLVFLGAACTKEEACQPIEEPDYALFAGSWQVREEFTNMRADTVFFHEAFEYQFILDENGTGQEIWPNFTFDIQLSINPVQGTVTVVRIVNPGNPSERQLTSSHFRLVEMGADAMLWRDVDKTVLSADADQTVTRELRLNKIQ